MPPGTPYQIASSTVTSATAVAAATSTGDALVGVFAGTIASNITGVTDSQGNLWARLHQFNSAGSFDVEVWAAFTAGDGVSPTVALSTSDTITPAFSSWANPRQHYTGLPRVSAEDVPVFTTATGTSAAPSSGASSALAQAAEASIGVIVNGNGGGAVTWDSPWTGFSAVHTGTTAWLDVAWQLTSSTSPVTASGTIVSAAWTGLVVSFVPPPSGTPSRFTGLLALASVPASAAVVVEPVVSSSRPHDQWFRTRSANILRNTLQDVTVSAPTPGPIVQSETFTQQWFDTSPVIIIAAPQAPPPPAQPTVESQQPPAVFFDTNIPQILRNAPPDTSQLTTPSPVVETSQPSGAYFRSSVQVIQAPQAPPIVSTATPQPVVETSQPDRAYYKAQSPVIVDNSQPPPVVATSTSSPTVVTSPTPQTWLKPSQALIVRNLQSPVQPQQGAPAPVVSSREGIRVGRRSHVQVIRSVVLDVTTRTPLHLGGTLLGNVLGGTVTGNVLAGTVTGNVLGGAADVIDVLGGSATEVNVLAGTVVDGNVLGGTASMQPILAATLDEWTMQEIDINLGEFNDETLAVAITSAGSPLDLTGKTLQALFKTAAGVSDTDPSTITLTSPAGGITVTNAVGGLASIAIPRADISSTGITFWRLDVVSGGLHNTAIYGKVGITLL